MDRQTHGLTDGTDYSRPDFKKTTTQKRGHILRKFHKMTHIKFKKRSIICVVQYTSASSKHMQIVSNPSAGELCNVGMFLQ